MEPANIDPLRVGVVGLRHGMACVHEVVRNPAYQLAGLCSGTDEGYRYLCGEPIRGPLDSVTFTAAREELIADCRRHCDFTAVPFHHDYQRLLAQPDLEAVILAPPIRLNAEFAMAALETGKHVLAAKPFARTLEQARKLEATVRAASTTFMLGFEFRQAPMSMRIKAALDSGALGDLRLMWWNAFRMPFRANYRDVANSGGAYIAEICHWFDLFRYWNKDVRFRRVAAFGGLDVHKDIQTFADNAVSMIEYENDVRATINFTYFTDQPQHNVFGLVGTEGKLSGDTEGAGRFVLHNGPDKARTETVIDPNHAHQGHLGFDVMHRRFAEIVRSGARINEEEAEAGMESLLIALATQTALDDGVIITREQALAF